MIRVLVALVLSTALGRAGQSTPDQLTGKGILQFMDAYRAWDGLRFTEAVKTFRQASESRGATATNFYWLGTGEFHRALQLLGLPPSSTNKTSVEDALDSAVKALTRAVQLNSHHAECHALLGTIYGMEIGENRFRAVWLGPRLQKELKLALNDGGTNPRVQYLLGTSQYYCAGREASRREALATLLLAEKLFEAEDKRPPAPLEPRWGHASCLTFIASCYEKLGQSPDAANYYRNALALDPHDGLALEGLARLTKNHK